MKRGFILLSLIAVGVLVLAGCAGLPEPTSETESLVVLGFTLDFPDGFFNLAPREVENGVRLSFRDESTGRTFSRTTNDGYVSFVAEAGHTYILEFLSYELSRNNGVWTISRPLEIRWEIEPQTIAYLGDINLVYQLGAVADRDRQGRDETTTWEFQVSSNVNDNSEGAKDYVLGRAPESAWLNYPMSFVPALTTAPVKRSR